LIPEILKFEKCLKYANEMSDDVIHSSKYYIKYINSSIFINLQQKSLKLGRLLFSSLSSHHADEAPLAINNVECLKWSEKPFTSWRSGTQYVAMVTK